MSGKRCNCSVVGIVVEDMTTARVLCPVHGSYYLYKNDRGKWETEKERRERLKLLRVCESCGAEFTLSADTAGGRNTLYCPPCSGDTGLTHSEAAKKYWKERNGRRANNPNTPWRKRAQVERPRSYRDWTPDTLERVLYLYDQEGLTLLQIAERYIMSENNAAVVLRKARAAASGAKERTAS